MKKTISCALILLSLSTSAKLLDKVAGVINDKVYTLSEMKEIKKTLPARKEIAGFVYTKKKYSLEDIFTHLRNKFIIKQNLAEQGIVITDERVEEQIEQTKKRLGITQSILAQSLKDRGLNFEQYFELTREITEYNVFNRNIISPLVNITEQEMKNLFYKRSDKKNTLNFSYNIVDYSIPKSSLSKSDLKRIKDDLLKYKDNGVLPGKLRALETNDIGNVSDEDLPSDISKSLRASLEGTFTDPILKGNAYHLFYVKKKELSESSEYLQVKNRIYGELFMKRSAQITKSWFSREALNFYILKNI